MIGLVVGIVAACILNYLALGMAGGGHGWVYPFFVSPATLFAFPTLGGVLAMSPSKRKLAWLVGLVVAGIAADIWLINSTQSEGSGYFQMAMDRGPTVVIVWLAIWGAPQVLALVAALRLGVASSWK